MIYYDHLPLDKDILKALGELSIDNDAAKQENVRKLVIEFDKRRMMVVAEGVEEKEEFECLTGLGVDLFQGYYLARPA